MDNTPQNASQGPTPVVTLSPSALAKIRSMMERDGKQDCGLRLGVIPGGCAGLSYDMRFQKQPYENDLVLEQDGLPIFINPESLVFLKGTSIDYVDTLKDSGFKYHNPNAHGSCGCGTSFS